MSDKVYDQQGRWRNKPVGFHMSPEENETLDAAVRLSGMSKQDYIINKLLDRSVVVQGNPKVYIELKREMERIKEELEKIGTGETISKDTLDVIELITNIMDGMREESDWSGDVE